VIAVDGRPGELVADWNRAMAAGRRTRRRGIA
jgi:hypothetical protein